MESWTDEIVQPTNVRLADSALTRAFCELAGFEPATSSLSAPVLVVQGSETKSLAVTSAQHVADNVPNARIEEIPGAGHAVPLTHPEALAEALAEFFVVTRQPA